jgi:hypothetical protein
MEKLARLHESQMKWVTYWIVMGIVLAVGIFIAGVLVGWGLP